MIPVAGMPVLRRLVDKFKGQGVNEIIVVAGYRAEAIDVQGIEIIVNSRWQDTGELASLYQAVDSLQEDTVVLYGDLLFRTYILKNLLDWEEPLLVVVDSSPLDQAKGNTNDLAFCSAVDDRAMYQQKVSLQRVSSESTWQGRAPDGRWIGLLRMRGEGRQRVLTALDTLRKRADFDQLGLPDLLNQLVADRSPPQVQYISGHWMDINSLDDLQRASEFAQGQRS